MSGLLAHVLEVPAWSVLLTVGLVVFAEDALFVGFILPGETAAILGGVAAKLGHVPLPAVLLTVIGAAILGDSVGYEVGRHFGQRVLALHILDRRRQRLSDAQDFLARRGGAAVFLGRGVAFFRAVMPALAGTARMPYPRFLATTRLAASLGAPPSSFSATPLAPPTPASNRSSARPRRPSSWRPSWPPCSSGGSASTERNTSHNSQQLVNPKLGLTR